MVDPGAMPRPSRKSTSLAGVSDKVLLALRFCDLPPWRTEAADKRLADLEARLARELRQAGLQHFSPDLYYGDQWFSPAGVPKVAVPFYLADARLVRLERLMMREAEGAGPLARMQLLRHEAGHCFDHAYGVSKTREWRQIFGGPRPYRPDVYVPQSRSKDFVRHLPGGYAQAHPDEDFAETFAVVVTPGSDWRRRYRHWPVAFTKCAYVASLLQRLGPLPPRVDSGPDCYNARRMRLTLARHYARRQAEAAAHRAAVKRLTAGRRALGT
jgi:hypothetical protein